MREKSNSHSIEEVGTKLEYDAWIGENSLVDKEKN